MRRRFGSLLKWLSAFSLCLAGGIAYAALVLDKPTIWLCEVFKADPTIVANSLAIASIGLGVFSLVTIIPANKLERS